MAMLFKRWSVMTVKKKFGVLKRLAENEHAGIGNSALVMKAGVYSLASGAVFGLLAAYGFLFPNTELYLMFIPVPIKAKYFVMGYAAIELFSGISNSPNDNVAHFAHLGGALVGIVMVLIWQKQKNQFF